MLLLVLFSLFLCLSYVLDDILALWFFTVRLLRMRLYLIPSSIVYTSIFFFGHSMTLFNMLQIRNIRPMFLLLTIIYAFRGGWIGLATLMTLVCIWYYNYAL